MLVDTNEILIRKRPNGVLLLVGLYKTTHFLGHRRSYYSRHKHPRFVALSRVIAKPRNLGCAITWIEAEDICGHCTGGRWLQMFLGKLENTGVFLGTFLL
jgi:hypothetical protein